VPWNWIRTAWPLNDVRSNVFCKYPADPDAPSATRAPPYAPASASHATLSHRSDR
jgi:hypothetical protein